MDWSSGPPSHWGAWENLEISTAKAGDYPREVQASEWGIGEGSLCSSAVGFCADFDLGNGCESRSSTWTTIDFAVTAKSSASNLPLVSEAEEQMTADRPGMYAETAESVGSAEPFIGLKLGKRTYFEDVCAENPGKNPASLSSAPAVSSAKTRRPRASQQVDQIPRCQVEGCDLDLSSARDYHRKHRVCESHSKCPKVIVAGRDCRFCQQCSRFHNLSEFDQKKRSCRRRLSDHNARRRKPPSGSRLLPTSCYDRRLPLEHFLGASNMPLWGSPFDVALMQAKGSSARPIEEGVPGGQLNLPGDGAPGAVFRPRHGFQQLLPMKSSTANQEVGRDLEVAASNLDGAPDFRRALSLLSNGHCGSEGLLGDAVPLDPFAQLNYAGVVGAPSHLPLTSMGSWETGQPPPPREDEQVAWVRPSGAPGGAPRRCRSP